MQTARQRTPAQIEGARKGGEAIRLRCERRQEQEREDLRAMKERRQQIEENLLARVAQLTGNVLR